MNKIEEQFVSYQVKVIPANATETQLRETQRAFYAGAVAMRSIIDSIARRSITDMEGANSDMQELQREVDRHVERVLKGVA